MDREEKKEGKFSTGRSPRGGFTKEREGCRRWEAVRYRALVKVFKAERAQKVPQLHHLAQGTKAATEERKETQTQVRAL